MLSKAEAKKLIDFYEKYDLCMETDLFDAYYLTDPVCCYESPSFEKIDELERWVIDDMPKIEALLEVYYGPKGKVVVA